MKYLQHFSLDDDPFRNTLRLRDYFQTPASKDARMRLERGIRQERGLVLFTGELGSGKSLVIRQLLEALEEEVFEANLVVLLKSEVDAHWLITRFAKLLGVEEPAEQPDALLAQVYEQLAIVREDGRHAVFIVDDADALATQGALADFCGLLKLEYEERRLFTLVLVGGPTLGYAMAADPVLQHHTEVAVHMQPLDATAGTFYLNKRVEQAGGDTSLLAEGAAAAIFDAAGGRPGLMNVLADNALYEAYLAGHRGVAPEDVATARAALGWDSMGAAGPASVHVTSSDLSNPAPEPVEVEFPARKPKARPVAESTVLMDGGVDDDPPALDLLEPMETTDSGLDDDLDAVFADSGPLETQGIPEQGPPKDEDEEDLVVALLEEE